MQNQRFAGDFLAQGLTPTRLHADGITDVLRDLSGLPLERFPADSVITELEDAVIHPEKHRDLGYSTRFVTLEPVKQREFLSRQILH